MWIQPRFPRRHPRNATSTKPIIALGAIALALAIMTAPAFAVMVTIHNDVPRVDQNGDIVDAHDGSIARYNGTYYLYGTAYNNQNGFSFSNRFVVYSSPDLVTWTFHGDITTVMDSTPGMYFRPHVVFNPGTKKYVLWYNWYARGTDWAGRFGVATADQPWGPFTVQNPNVTFPQGTSVGDFAVLSDTDGKGWCVYGWHNGGVAPLAADYLSIGSGYSSIGSGEGFSAFKRGNFYYYLWGKLCCFCSGGSTANVSRATVATGPFTSVGDIVGANVHAQPLGILQMETVTGPQYAYVGDRWQSTPDDMKGHDFLYISEPLTFAANGNIARMAAFTNSFTVDLAPGVPSPGPAVTRNLARGRTATASSSLQTSGWGLAHVTDGGNFSVAGRNMGWSSNNMLTANHTEWITVDLGAPAMFDRIVLYPRVNTSGTGTCPDTIPDDALAGAGFPSDFTIESSTDNATWTNLVSRSSFPAPYIVAQRFDVTPTVGRYVRITGTRLNPVGGEYRMQFAEIAVSAARSGGGGADGGGWWRPDAGGGGGGGRAGAGGGGGGAGAGGSGGAGAGGSAGPVRGSGEAGNDGNAGRGGTGGAGGTATSGAAGSPTGQGGSGMGGGNRQRGRIWRECRRRNGRQPHDERRRLGGRSVGRKGM